MQEKHNSNGFMFGLMIGAAVGALVSTKKGREILKNVADYGLEYVGNIINLDDLESAFEDDGEEMSSYASNDAKAMMDKKASGDKMSVEGEETVPKGNVQEEEPKKPLRRRLFRGIRKK